MRETKTTYTCDRCAKLEPEKNGYSPHDWVSVKVSTLYSADLIYNVPHLCKECAKHLRNFLAQTKDAP